MNKLKVWAWITTETEEGYHHRSQKLEVVSTTKNVERKEVMIAARSLVVEDTGEGGARSDTYIYLNVDQATVLRDGLNEFLDEFGEK